MTTFSQISPLLGFLCIFLWIIHHSPEQTCNLLKGWGEVAALLCENWLVIWGPSCTVFQTIPRMSVPFHAFSLRGFCFLQIPVAFWRENLVLHPQSWVSTLFTLLNPVSVLWLPNLCWHLLSVVISSHSLCSCGFVPF